MRILRLAGLAAVVLAVAAFTAPARAELSITIDKSIQRMTVALDGAELFVWPVSTGASGYDTPSGEFKPFRMERDHFSREWDDAPMPNSIFFTQQGHAIHGSYHKSIGQPASHGCVRLEPKNARTLFGLVRKEGMKNTRVVLTGEAPATQAPQVARRAPSRDDVFEREFQRGESYDEDYAVTAQRRRQRVVRGWREYNEGPSYYYYRQRSYAPPPRGYGDEGPFEYLFRR